MITVFVPIRNAAGLARECLRSLAETFRTLRSESAVEYLLLDDASNPQCEVPALMTEFRRQTASKVRIFQFKTHQHYTAACALGMSKARGEQFILISHDMLVTPTYIRTLLAVAAVDPKFGIIRGASAHMDCSPHAIVPAVAIQSGDQAVGFSKYVSEVWGLSAFIEPILIGDSILIQRSVIDRIGVMDRTFFGFLGDVDYGLRARRAGFQLVCAKGAWLHHFGGGAVGAEVAAGRQSPETVIDGMSMLDAAYRRFGEKWRVPLPGKFNQMQTGHLEALLNAPPPAEGEYVPPCEFDPESCVEL